MPVTVLRTASGLRTASSFLSQQPRIGFAGRNLEKDESVPNSANSLRSSPSEQDDEASSYRAFLRRGEPGQPPSTTDRVRQTTSPLRSAAMLTKSGEALCPKSPISK